MYRKYDRFSFPSGHTARVWVIVVIVAFFDWPLATALSVWAVLITYSRLKLRLHHFTDVTAGVIIGVAVGFFVMWMGSILGFL
jgi:undecaprenyl-diphosphatase